MKSPLLNQHKDFLIYQVGVDSLSEIGLFDFRAAGNLGIDIFSVNPVAGTGQGLCDAYILAVNGKLYQLYYS